MYQGLFFYQPFQSLRVQGLFHLLGEAGPHLGPIAIADRLNEESSELRTAKGFTQYVKDRSAQGLPFGLQFPEKGEIHIPFPGLLSHHVPEMTHLGLADTMDASETLLDAVGIPGEVIVDHQVCTLKVDAFPRCVCGHQDLNVFVLLE